MHRNFIISSLLICLSVMCSAATGTWNSPVAGIVSYTSNKATNARKDYNGKLFTVVYLENLGFDKVGQNTCKIRKRRKQDNAVRYRVYERCVCGWKEIVARTKGTRCYNFVC